MDTLAVQSALAALGYVPASADAGSAPDVGPARSHCARLSIVQPPPRQQGPPRLSARCGGGRRSRGCFPRARHLCARRGRSRTRRAASGDRLVFNRLFRDAPRKRCRARRSSPSMLIWIHGSDQQACMGRSATTNRTSSWPYESAFVRATARALQDSGRGRCTPLRAYSV
jgi:hypothetical protein